MDSPGADLLITIVSLASAHETIFIIRLQHFYGKSYGMKLYTSDDGSHMEYVQHSWKRGALSVVHFHWLFYLASYNIYANNKADGRDLSINENGLYKSSEIKIHS